MRTAPLAVFLGSFGYAQDSAAIDWGRHGMYFWTWNTEVCSTRVFFVDSTTRARPVQP